MKAPMSEITRKMLANPKLAKQLMMAIIADRMAERGLIEEDQKPILNVDGQKFRLARVRNYVQR
jgi:hypothetical protein